jgi:translation initiation factor IF-3
MSRKRTHVPQRGPSSEHRINHQIRVPKVRVVTEGKGIEELDTKTAIRLAEEAGLDLVEVSPNQDPPVCKIIDYGKYKYEQQKKKKEQAKNQHVIHIKEIKLKPKIGDHDYEIKVKHGVEFLDKGDKVKFSLRFRGREMAHPELGMKIMERVVKDVDEVGVVEAPAKMEGRQIIMVIAPRPKKKVAGKSSDNKDEGEATAAEEAAAPESE